MIVEDAESETSPETLSRLGSAVCGGFARYGTILG